MENTKMKLTGKPSIDKPWLQFYPEQLRNVEVPKMTIEEFLKYKNQDENRTAFEYYGNKITWKTLWKEVDKAARSLKVLGYGDGRRIPLFLQSVPAHYILLMAAERIGATIICRDDIPEELCFAIRKSKADTAFVMDYTSKEERAFVKNLKTWRLWVARKESKMMTKQSLHAQKKKRRMVCQRNRFKQF